MAKAKFYTVWKGETPGVYDQWEIAKKQIDGFTGARYKSFPTMEAAQQAFDMGESAFYKQVARETKAQQRVIAPSSERPNVESLAVDAACSGNPGNMEYRGVYTRDGRQLFHIGPLAQGTNNVGEFLALVHGLAYLNQKGMPHFPIYSDSVNAIKWVQNKKCKTLLERVPANEQIFELIARAEKWLQTNRYTNPILKWDTSGWGEIPADFGRK